MLQAMNTGHEGSLSTVHANTPRDALARIETMVLMAGYDLPVKAIRQQVASALDMVVHLERLQDGSRRVTAVTEVQGMESDVITLQELFKFKIDSFDAGRHDRRGLRSTGLRPVFVKKFEHRGIELPPPCSARARRSTLDRGSRREEPAMKRIAVPSSAWRLSSRLRRAAADVGRGRQLTEANPGAFPDRAYVLTLPKRQTLTHGTSR